MSLLKVTTNKGTSAIVMAPDPSGYAFCLPCSPRTCGVFGSQNTRRVVFVEEDSEAQEVSSHTPSFQISNRHVSDASCVTARPCGRAACGVGGVGSCHDRPGCRQPLPSSWGLR